MYIELICFIFEIGYTTKQDKLILTLMLISPKMTTREMIPNAFIRYF